MKISFISGKFNAIHIGHLRLFKFAKENSDKLIIGLLPDKLNQSKFTVGQSLRMEALKSIKLIDEIIMIKKNVNEEIQKILPDLIIKGAEFANLKNTEEAVAKQIGAKILFGSGEAYDMSSHLLKETSTKKLDLNLNPLKNYIKRHRININELIKSIKTFNQIKTLVIGDLIIDDYISCNAVGMSKEDPTIVVTPFETKTFVGGAGIVAAHAAQLGSIVEYIGICGDDNEINFISNFFNKNNVHHKIFIDTTRPTIKKKRYRAENKTLLRVNELRRHPVNESIINKIYKYIKKNIDSYDLIMFSDFSYGCLPEDLINKIIKLSKNRNITLTADSQSSSQIGNILKFKEMDLVTPTEHEARITLRDEINSIASVGEELMNLTKSKNILITLGKDGCLIFTDDNNVLPENLYAPNRKAIDTSGAGDSMFCACSLGLANKLTIWQSTFIASAMACLQVSKIGNDPISMEDLQEVLINMSEGI